MGSSLQRAMPGSSVKLTEPTGTLSLAEKPWECHRRGQSATLTRPNGAFTPIDSPMCLTLPSLARRPAVESVKLTPACRQQSAQLTTYPVGFRSRPCPAWARPPGPASERGCQAALPVGLGPVRRGPPARPSALGPHAGLELRSASHLKSAVGPWRPTRALAPMGPGPNWAPAPVSTSNTIQW